MSLSKIVLSLDMGGTRRIQVHENNEVFIKYLLRSVPTSHDLAQNVLSVQLMTSRNKFSYRQLVK